MMEFFSNVIGHRLSVGLRGKIDKNFILDNKIFDQLDEDKNVSEIVFILRKVESIDPEGVQSWYSEIRRVSDKGYDLTFIECPQELLTPLLKKNGLNSNKAIRSFIVPYYCSSCNEEYPQLINTSSMSLSFSSYSKPSCPSCKKQLSLDITEDEVARISSLLPIHDSYDDKRKYPRFDVSSYGIIATVEINNDKHEFNVINFSEAGICIAGDSFIETGNNIDIRINFKGVDLTSIGTVVWYSQEDINNYLIGISLATSDIFHLLIKQ